MNSVYRRLLWLYPAEQRCEFGDEMCAVFQEVRAEINGEALPTRAAFLVREFSGLLVGALREHVHNLAAFNLANLLSLRRFNMRNGFRFPKSTAILMTIILLGVIVAIRKGEAIANSLPRVNAQIGPIEVGHSTLLPPIALFVAFFWGLGLLGWVILFAMRRSGVHRLDELTGQPK
ncbi:MAG TPA: hypothetical protein VM715_00050 [Candidatus Acidoferrum sp.]|jgi:hypothetical protein|nr:hypothetical protein [Candidatus Acidoferrum sp.]